MPPKRQSFSAAELAHFVSQGVAEALAAQSSQRNHRRSDDTVNDAPVAKTCTYKDFLNCKPLNFKGTEGAIGLVRWFERMETVLRISNCPDDCRVKYSTCTFYEGALTWWNSYVQSVGIDAAYQLPWEELKRMLRDEYCPNEELQKMEEEFWNLRMQGADIAGYTTRFQQLALLCPAMVDPERKRIERYIRGLPEKIQGHVTSSKPGTIQSAIRMAHELVAQSVRCGTSAQATENNFRDNKRKADENPGNQNQANKRTATNKSSASESNDKIGYKGTKPYCSKCSLHHDGSCPCTKCKRFGHEAKDCKTVVTGANTSASKTCYECNGTGHFRKDCPQLKNKNNNTARGRSYVLRAREDPENPRIIDVLNEGTITYQ